MIRRWGRTNPDGWASLVASVISLAVIWAGSIVVVGVASRLAVVLFCIGYRC